MSRFNFNKYSFLAWMKANKEFLKILAPMIISIAITKNWIEAGFGAIIGKFILDGIDYFVSK